jgi:hypothetical protein
MCATDHFRICLRIGHRVAPWAVSRYSTRGRDLRIDVPGHKAIPLGLVELPGEHPFAQAGDRAPELGEAVGAFAQADENGRLVAAAEQPDEVFDGGTD